MMNLLRHLPKFAISMKVKPNKKPQVPFKKWSLYKGDEVILRSGKDKGKTGKITRVFRRQNAVIIDGINVRQGKKRTRTGSFKTTVRSLPVHISKVALLDPQLKVATKIFFAYDQTTGKKIRISKKSNTIINRPMLPQYSKQHRLKGKGEGAYDTKPAKVLEVTYKGEDFEAIKREFEALIAQKERREKLLVFKI